MCNSIFQVDVDYVFVLKQHVSQKLVSEILNNSIPTSLKPNFHSGLSFCLEGIFRILCNYYLSPCGNATFQIYPSSVCPDECSFIENECPEEWNTLELELRLEDKDFIKCDDTNALLFPLRSCCRDVGLRELDLVIEEG